MNLQDYITLRGVENLARDLGVSSHTVRSWRRVRGRRLPRQPVGRRIVELSEGKVSLPEIYPEKHA
jgi:transposase-like protein